VGQLDYSPSKVASVSCKPPMKEPEDGPAKLAGLRLSDLFGVKRESRRLHIVDRLRTTGATLQAPSGSFGHLAE